MNDRRIARRYDLSVPVFIGEAGLRHLERLRGLTCDISTSGLYFTMAHPPAPGSRVELTLTLPGMMTGSNDLVVAVVGRVVRVDQRMDQRMGQRAASAASGAASGVGVAAHIEKYDIISTHPALQGSALAG